MDNTKILKLWFIFCALISFARSKKILLLPHLQGSHVFELTTIGEQLVARGHEVHCVIPEESGYMSLLKNKHISALTFEAEHSELLDSDNTITQINNLIFTEKGPGQEVRKVFGDTMGAHCDYIMEDAYLLNRTRSFNFDLAVVDTHFLGQCLVLFPHLLGIPYVGATQFFWDWEISVPHLPSAMSVIINQFEGTFLNKIRTLGKMLMINYPLYHLRQKTDLLQKYAPEIDSFAALIEKARLFIITRDHILDHPQPSMPNVLRVPGYSYKPARPLPESLAAQIPDGKPIIVVSFGSTAGNMPKETIQKFLDAFASFPDYVVLWKLPNTEDVILNKNVITLPWLPQNDILGHNRVVLFITHCGANGLHEAFYHGVPLIGFPLFAEQHLNAKLISNKGYGLSLDINAFTVKQLVTAMGKILNTNAYKNKLTKVSAMLHDRTPPREEVAFWIEHVMKYGDDHIRPLSANSSLHELCMFDIMTVLLMCIVTVFLIAFIVIRCLSARCCGQNREMKLKSE